MSDVMLLGVLRMPYELAMSDDLSRAQFHQRAQQAADRIESDADRIAALELALAQRDGQINELKELLCEAGQHIEYDPGGELSARIDAARPTSSVAE